MNFFQRINNMVQRWIKLFDPSINKNEEKAVVKTLKSKFWATGSGDGNVEKFEKGFKKYLGSKKCVAVNSGTAALHLALSLIDIKGKEVLLPSLSFASTAHAVLYNGGIPKFVDVDEKTLCIDPNEIEKKITQKTSIILPVHFAGMSCKLDKILKICNDNNLKLIEDAAHASGSKFQNKKIGTHGMAVCFSFHPVKNLAMPTGGLISLNGEMNSKNEQDIKSRRWCGISNRKGTAYDVKELGWNYYMNEFSATIGLEQLRKLDRLNSIRTNTAKRFFDEIKLENKMQFEKDCSYHFYWIRVKKRSKFIDFMKNHKIETGIHYKPIHKMSLYSNKIKLKVTDKIANDIVSLPTHPNLSQDDISRIINAVNKWKNN
jgi:perosamine synthetase